MTPLEQRARAILDREIERVGCADSAGFGPDGEDLWAKSIALRAIMSALSDDDWRPIEEATPTSGEMLGWTDGCGFEVVRMHSDGTVHAGAFSADWVKWVRPLPAPPVVGER